MTGLLRKAMLLACGGVFVASSALAAIPSPADSDIPCGINLVATVSGAADPKGLFTITVRDVAQNPIPGSSVVIDFDACVAAGNVQDIRLCSVQPAPGVTATCTSPVGEISAVTNGSGSVTLTIVGNAQNVGAAPAAGFNCATVFADGVNMGTINVGTFDEDGSAGYLADGSSWKEDYKASINPPFPSIGRSDFDCDGQLLADLAVWFQVYKDIGASNSTSCTANCP